MKHDMAKGSWQRVVVYTPEDKAKADSKNTSPLSNKTKNHKNYESKKTI